MSIFRDLPLPLSACWVGSDQENASKCWGSRETLLRVIARNPEKSNRAIAAEIGVDDKTVAKARRNSGVDNSAPEKRLGKDGKMYPSKKKSITRPAKPEELDDSSLKAGRHIDTRTGETPIAAFPAQ